MAKTAEKRLSSAKDGERAGALINLLEENARWNAERRNAAANDIRRQVDKTKTINPDFRKELLIAWEFFLFTIDTPHLPPSALPHLPPSTLPHLPPSTLPHLPLPTPN